MPDGQQQRVSATYMVKRTLHEQLRRTTYGPPTHPAVEDGVILEAHRGRLFEGKRAEARVDNLVTAQHKARHGHGEHTRNSARNTYRRIVFLLEAKWSRRFFVSENRVRVDARD